MPGEEADQQLPPTNPERNTTKETRAHKEEGEERMRIVAGRKSTLHRKAMYNAGERAVIESIPVHRWQPSPGPQTLLGPQL